MLTTHLCLLICALYIRIASSYVTTRTSKLSTSARIGASGTTTKRYVQQIIQKQDEISTRPAPYSNDRRRSEIGELELSIRRSISQRALNNTAEILRGLNTTRLPSGRDVVYVIAETSRRARNVGGIVSLLTALPLVKLDYTTEDDVIPTLVECCSRTNRLDVATKMISLLRRRGVHFSAKSYSILISGYGRLKSENMINRVLRECIESCVEADVVLLNSVMDAYIRCGKAPMAVALFDVVTGASDSASSSPEAAATVKTTDRTDSKTGSRISQKQRKQENNNSNKSSQQQVQGEEEYLVSLGKYFKGRSQKALFPSVRTYNTLLKALRYSGTGSFDRCMSVFERMKEEGVSPDSITLNTLVDASVIAGNLDAAEKLLADANRMTSATTTSSSSSSSSPYNNDKNSKNGGNNNDATATSSNNKRPGVEAYTALISGYASSGNVPAAFRVLDLMTSQGVLPNSYTLTSLMKTCINAGDWSSARDLLNIGTTYLGGRGDRNTSSSTGQMEQQAVVTPSPPPPCSSFSSRPLLSPGALAALHGAFVIGLCGSAMSAPSIIEREKYLHEAQRELLKMETNKLRPDTATVNSFIQALSAMQPSRVGDALLVFRAMEAEGIKADVYTYSILLTALGREGYLEEALQLYRTANVVLDDVAVNALLRAFVSGPDPVQALEMYQALTASPATSRSSSSSTSSSTSFSTSTSPQEQDPSNWPRFKPTKFTFTILFLAIARSVAPLKFGGIDRKGGLDSFNSYSLPPPPPSSLSSSSSSLPPDDNDVDSLYHGDGSSSSSEHIDPFIDNPAFDTNPPSDSPSSPFTPFTPLTALGKVIALISYTSYTTSGDAESLKDRMQSIASTIFPEGAIDPSLRGSRAYLQDQSNSVAAAAAAAVGAGAASGAATSDTIRRARPLRSLTADEQLHILFKSMRYDYKINADHVMVSVLNSLFASQFPSSHSSSSSSFSSTADTAQWPPTSLSTFTYGFTEKNYYSLGGGGGLGGGKKSAFSKKTAEFIFEDLAISGWHPKDLVSILQSCSYPVYQSMELLREGNDNLALKKLRQSAASYRIFKKHGWNKVESGWNGFF